MALEDVHVLELDRATSRLELRRINPTRGFMKVPLDEQGRPTSSAALYIWQNGKWFGAGKEEIEADFVPQKFRDEIKANPVTVKGEGPAVTATCQFCGKNMNSSEMESHLVEHVHQTMQAAGNVKTDYAAEKSATAKNTHLKTEKV
jgi:hypothetical protein